VVIKPMIARSSKKKRVVRKVRKTLRRRKRIAKTSDFNRGYIKGGRFKDRRGGRLKRGGTIGDRRREKDGPDNAQKKKLRPRERDPKWGGVTTMKGGRTRLRRKGEE